MKAFPRLLLCSAMLLAGATGAQAADPYPVRPIRIVVNSAPGALLDATTRVVAQRMAENLGQAVVVENRPGADGQLGIRYVKTAAADGYTLLATANTIAQLPALKIDPGYDLKDFIGVGMMNRAPLILVGNPAQQYKSLPELIAGARAHPDGLTFASGGSGTTTHIAVAMMLHQAGIRMMHVPYKGSATAMPDVLTGRVNMILDGGNSSRAHIQEGRLRAFGITSAQRSPAFPEIPTIAEQGLPNYAFFVYLGLVAPADTPKDVVQRLAQAMRAALDTDSVRDRFKRDGADAGNVFGDEFTEYLKQDMQRTNAVVTGLGLPKE